MSNYSLQASFTAELMFLQLFLDSRLVTQMVIYLYLFTSCWFCLMTDMQLFPCECFVTMATLVCVPLQQDFLWIINILHEKRRMCFLSKHGYWWQIVLKWGRFVDAGTKTQTVLVSSYIKKSSLHFSLP